MNQKPLRFNISASSLNLYRESQLLFYYQYVLKADPDSPVPVVYGLAGSIVHDMIENNKDIDDYEAEFNKQWEEKDLYNLPGLNGKPLDKETFFNAFVPSP